MKRFVQNAALVLASMALTLAAAELALRWLPGKYGVWFEYYTNDRTTVTYRSLGDGLHVAAETTAARKHGPCFEIAPVRINAAGFRDRPWTVGKKKFRVAVLGDSFVEALQVAEGEDVGSQLENRLGIEVLKAGVSGYSTVTELEAFRQVLKGYRPDLTVLFFYAGNDVSGNSCRLDPGRPLCGSLVENAVFYRRPMEEGNIGGEQPFVVDRGEKTPANRSWDRVKGFFRRHFVLYLAMHDIKTLVQGLVAGARGEVARRWRLYLPGDSPEWREAWAVTEQALADLKAETETAGGHLAVVYVPEHFVTSREWQRELRLAGGTAVPPTFDPYLPARRLTEVTQRLDVLLLDLTPALIAYRDRHGLPYPHFSFACDGHWNPLAHALGGAEVAAFLAGGGLLPTAVDGATLEKERQALTLRPPRDILGERAFRQIYAGDVYTGGSRTAR